MRLLYGLIAGLLVACSGQGEDSTTEPDPRPSVPSGPPARQIGTGDGGPASVELVVIYTSIPARSATDLEFDPLRPDQLWVLLREFHSGLPCTRTVRQGCLTLPGSVVIVTNPDGPAPTSDWKQDPNAWHFMRLPTGIAFGANGNFATCGEARTGNFDDDAPNYMGPTLWSSDPSIFAVQPPGKNGSHLDMLHESPFCMGIAHEKDNVYWLMNGFLGSLDRYDFKAPHEVGGEDHSDGELVRFAEGEIERVPGIPSHMAFDAKRGLLYVVDTGHARVVALQATSGTRGPDLLVLEPMALARSMDGASLREIVPPGILEAPSGLAFHEDVLFVTDNATSAIHAFDLEGREVRKLDTGLLPGSLSGIEIGPDDKAYLSDLTTGEVRRIDPR